jgi:hypothetical protein
MQIFTKYRDSNQLFLDVFPSPHVVPELAKNGALESPAEFWGARVEFRASTARQPQNTSGHGELAALTELVEKLLEEPPRGMRARFSSPPGDARLRCAPRALIGRACARKLVVTCVPSWLELAARVADGGEGRGHRGGDNVKAPRCFWSTDCRVVLKRC